MNKALYTTLNVAKEHISEYMKKININHPLIEPLAKHLETTLDVIELIIVTTDNNNNELLPKRWHYVRLRNLTKKLTSQPLFHFHDEQWETMCYYLKHSVKGLYAQYDIYGMNH